MRWVKAVLFILYNTPFISGSSQIPLSDVPSYFPIKNAPSDEDKRLHDLTDNLIFSTVANLLQQWPNTLYRNGHTIVKGEIPVGTVLYHGRKNSSIPTVPEWLGTNVEHSYLLCGPPECWMLSFMVEEPLKIVYFDGSSASNSYLGHQDSQDVVIWGKVRPDKMMAEWERIEELCKWAQPYGLDAIVRMEPGFEVMLCDFSKKTKLISSLHIMASERGRPVVTNPKTKSFRTEGSLDVFEHRQKIRHTPQLNQTLSSAFDPFPTSAKSATSESASSTTTSDGGRGGHPPRGYPPQPIPPGWSGALRNSQSVSLEGVQAAAWNSYYPGEMRVKLDYTRLISFYSPKLSSLVESRESVPRWKHRLTEISKNDLDETMGWLKEDLMRESGEGSGIDWGTLTRTVMDRYKDRLWLLHQSLSPPLASPHSTILNITERASMTREQVLIMLTPYLIYGAVPTSSDARNTSWIEPIETYCSTQLTYLIPEEKLKRSEKMIKSATEGVLNKICTTLATIWIDALGVSSLTESKQGELLDTWRVQMDDLMEWLDWPVWHTCRPACGETEFCYQPTWPWGVPWRTPEDIEIDMTPKCIDRLRGSLGGPLPGMHEG